MGSVASAIIVERCHAMRRSPLERTSFFAAASAWLWATASLVGNPSAESSRLRSLTSSRALLISIGLCLKLLEAMVPLLFAHNQNLMRPRSWAVSPCAAAWHRIQITRIGPRKGFQTQTAQFYF